MQITRHFNPSKLTQLIGLLVIALSAIMLGLLGGCIGLGAGGLGTTPIKRSMLNVFRAAPFNWICGEVERMAHSLHLKAPPAYVKTPALIPHFSQSIPSSGWTSLVNVLPSRRIASGKTSGSRAQKDAPEAWIPDITTPWDACTRVDIWMSKSPKDATQTPTINDPDASATLVITPPSKRKSGNCTEWLYH